MRCGASKLDSDPIPLFSPGMDGIIQNTGRRAPARSGRLNKAAHHRACCDVISFGRVQIGRDNTFSAAVGSPIRWPKMKRRAEIR